MAKKHRNEQNKAAAPAAAKGDGGRLADYFWANLVFFAFLILLSFVVWKSCQQPGDDPAVRQVLEETFKFMIYLFGGGFLMVCLFDAAYDFFAEKAEKAESGDAQGAGQQSQ